MEFRIRKPAPGSPRLAVVMRLFFNQLATFLLVIYALSFLGTSPVFDHRDFSNRYNNFSTSQGLVSMLTPTQSPLKGMDSACGVYEKQHYVKWGSSGVTSFGYKKFLDIILKPLVPPGTSAAKISI